MRELFKKLENWYLSAIAETTVLRQIQVLEGEVKELKESIGSPMENSREELADCLLSVFTVSIEMGYSYDNLIELASEKLAILKTRKYIYSHKDGKHYRIK